MNISGTELNNLSGPYEFIDGNYRFNTKFLDEVSITERLSNSGVPLIKKLTFSNCIFKKRFEFKISLAEYIQFKNCTFESECDLSAITFSESVSFHNCTFKHELYLVHTTFSKNFIIDNSIFDGNINLDNTSINSYLSITNSVFNNNLLFINTVVNGLLILRNLELKKGLDLSLGVFNKMNLFSLDVKNFESSTNNNQKEYLKIVREDEKLIPSLNKLETFRIIRKYFESNGSIEKSNKYFKIEQEILHQKDISHDNKENKVILFFNKWSNRFNESVLSGILFTIFIGFIFYFLTLLTTEQFTWNFKEIDCNFSFINYIKFLNPTHNIENLNLDLNAGSYILDFLGRIFVGYGIYQTIAAFRRFKK